MTYYVNAPGYTTPGVPPTATDANGVEIDDGGIPGTRNTLDPTTATEPGSFTIPPSVEGGDTAK